METRQREGVIKGWLHSKSDLPNRFPVGRQLLCQDDKLIFDSTGLSLPSSVGGRGSGGGSSVDLVEKIRFVIAVNPSHRKIPFELGYIPLPAPLFSGDPDNRSPVDIP